MCNRDELHEINVKLDHISYVQCEIFTILKSYENMDNKLDQTIRLLHKINSNKQHTTVNTSSMPPIYVRPRGKTLNKISKGPSIQDSLMNELKLKLKKRGGIKD